MKKILALLLAAVMLLSMTACDLSTILELAMEAAESAETGDSGDETQPGSDEGDAASGAKSWDELDLPDGFPRLADSVDTFRYDETTKMYNFTWNSTDYATSEAMINTMNDWSNGRITGAVKGMITNWKIQNDRINLTASFDESSGMLMIMTQVFGGTDLTAYLAAHTLTEEDFKPVNFTEFSNFITSGEKFGGLTQVCAFEISIKDGKYKKEDAAAWCDTILKCLGEISTANGAKGVTNMASETVVSYADYVAKEGKEPEHPNIGGYFLAKLDGNNYSVQYMAGYNAETGTYRVQFQTMKRIY